MTKEQEKEAAEILKASVSYIRGDDLERARMAFKGLTPRQMQEQYGMSGRTRQQILDGYEAHAQRVENARFLLNEMLIARGLY